MGNSSSKDSRPRSGAAASGGQQQQQSLNSTIPPQSRSAEFRVVPDIYGVRTSASAGGARASRQDVPILFSRRVGGDNGAASREERPRETRQEREARRAERERQARLKERERSMREEGVDGGFLVTLGVYTGPEDFSKSIVRQLQIERRLAPFWKGLNDHSDSWAEHQLVAAVRGLTIPAADEIPPEMARTASQSSNPQGSDTNVNMLTIPISSRSQSYETSTSANLSASHPAFSNSASNNAPSAAQLLRGRAKTLASLATSSKSQSPDLTPQETHLPRDPNVNGTPIEAYLYKDAAECPICFMYYPPYLNKTRCCDQPICSECFVQIKRPDPHPPEHEQPGQPRPPEEEAETLVSEVAACPFCVTPEFGVSYDPPPFRRGLAYANQNGTSAAGHPLRNPTSAMSSSTSLTSGGSGTGRRRATSLSANAPQVITTDRVRPDWAKKLADARAHALRRSAAATALHNAAYVLGNQGDVRGGSSALAGFGRRSRRTILVDSATPGSGSGTGTPLHGGDGEDGASSSDLYPDRGSSRRGAGGARSRIEDIEELMMMEAIRLSLAAEEERKRKVEKEARKEAKKRDKEAKKEAKAAEKSARKNNGSISSLSNVVGASASSAGASSSVPTSSFAPGPWLYKAGTNDSTSTWASAAGTPSGSLMARSSSNLGLPGLPHQQQESIPEENEGGGSGGVQGGKKGKEPVQDFAGFNPLEEATSTLNTEMRGPGPAAGTGEEGIPSYSTPMQAATREDPQKHLEASRANLQPIVASASSATAAAPIPIPSSPHSSGETRSHLQQQSLTSSLQSHSSAGSGGGADGMGAGDSSPNSVGSSRGFSPSPGLLSPGEAGGTSPGLASEVGEGDQPMLNFATLATRMGGLDIEGANAAAAGEGGVGVLGGEKEGATGEHVEVAPIPAVADGDGTDATTTDAATATAKEGGLNGDLQGNSKVAGSVEVLDHVTADNEEQGVHSS